MLTKEAGVVSKQSFEVVQPFQETDADGELILLDFTQERFYGLNEVAAAIWHGISRGETPEQITAALAIEFDASAETIGADVLQIVESFVQKGWVRPAARD